MANGDIKMLDKDRFSVVLLDAQTASSNGIWVEVPPKYSVRSYHSTSLEEGASDATVDIMVSNAATKPADATDGEISKTLITSTQAWVVVDTFRWVKAKKTAGTTPIATTVILEAGKS